MRRIFQIPALCLAVGVIACDQETTIQTEALPYAGVRFINAVPDTGSMDFRFVDIVESNPHWQVSFRNNPVVSSCVAASTSVQYKGARAGQRHFRIFMNGSTAAVASTVVKDTTVTLEAGKNYTALLWGYANPSGPNRPAGAQPMRLTFIEESVQPGDGQVGLRIINASNDAVDVSHRLAAEAAPGTVLASNVAPWSMVNHVTTAPGSIRYNVRPAGGALPVLADAPAVAGAAAITGPPGPIDAIPGTSVAGSAVTAIAFAPPVEGSDAASAGAGFTISTGGISMSATATGYSRAAGSATFTTDCFFVGQEIEAEGFDDPANNGTSIVTEILPSRTTGSTSLSATAVGYERAAGSFLTNNFAPGMWITASGFTNAANNGRSLVTAVTATTLIVDKPGGTAIEAAATGRTIVGDQMINVTKAGGTVPEPAATGRSLSAPRLLSFVWDRRPPRPPGI